MIDGPAFGGHGVLKVTKKREQFFGKMLQHLEPFRSSQWPWKGIRPNPPNRFHPAGFHKRHQCADISLEQFGRRKRMIFGEFLTVGRIKIPFPTFGLHRRSHEDVVLFPHGPIKRLETICLFSFEKSGQRFTLGEEMLRI